MEIAKVFKTILDSVWFGGLCIGVWLAGSFASGFAAPNIMAPETKVAHKRCLAIGAAVAPSVIVSILVLLTGGGFVAPLAVVETWLFQFVGFVFGYIEVIERRECHA